MDVRGWILLGLCAAGTLQATPKLQLSTAAIGTINVPNGKAGATQTVTAANVGDGSLALSATATATWLVPTITGNSVQIALATATLTPGMYTDFVTVTSPGAIDAPQTISVTIQVQGPPASVELYAAPNGGTASVQFPVANTVQTAASTSDGRPWLAVSLNGQGSFNFVYPYLIAATSQAGQPEGNYTGSVVVSGSANAADNRTVAVTFHVTSQPIAQFASSSPLVLYGVAAGGKVTSAAVVTNAGSGNLTISGATGSAGWLTGVAANNSVVSVTADPGALQPGVYRANLSLTSNAANAGTNPLAVEFIVQAASAPQISPGGVVDNTTFKSVLAPGDIASVYGLQLGTAVPASASALPLATTLGGVQVQVNGIPAPVYYTSSGQVNFQVPFEVSAGPGLVSVSRNGQQGNTVSTTINATAPRILRIGLDNYGIIVNQDGSFPMPVTPGIFSHPAKAGDVLTIYAIGLGATTPPVASGVGAPGAEPLARTHVPVVTFGGGFQALALGQVLYSGLTPSFVGLYQINVTVPTGLPTFDRIGLQFTLDGVTSNNVMVAITQ